MITVLLADDHSLFRKGLRNMLEIEDDIQVVGEARDGAEARRMAQELRPDVTLLDINMPVLDGIGAAREIRRDHPRMGIVMLTMFAEEEFVERALEAGANGYLLKDTPFRGVVETVRAAASGESLVEPPVASPVASPAPAGAAHPNLDRHDADLLQLVVDGLSDEEIAARLGLTPPLVQEHLAALCRRLGVANRTRAAIYALSQGLAAPPR